MNTHVLEEGTLHPADSFELSRRATMLLAFSGAILLGITAQFKLPLPGTPVPITLQTLMLLLGGFLLPHFGGVQMTLWYVLLGAVGLPFFAGGKAGIAVLTGPTAGYIIGFVAAGAYLGAVRKYSQKSITIFLHALIAHTMVFMFGIAGLCLFMKVDFKQAVALGVAPFVVGDVYKSIAAVSILKVSRFLLLPKK